MNQDKHVNLEYTCHYYCVCFVCLCVYVCRWFRQHEYIEKLNMQAILNASANQEEFIKDLFVSLGKVLFIVC